MSKEINVANAVLHSLAVKEDYTSCTIYVPNVLCWTKCSRLCFYKADIICKIREIFVPRKFLPIRYTYTTIKQQELQVTNYLMKNICISLLQKCNSA